MQSASSLAFVPVGMTPKALFRLGRRQGFAAMRTRWSGKSRLRPPAVLDPNLASAVVASSRHHQGADRPNGATRLSHHREDAFFVTARKARELRDVCFRAFTNRPVRFRNQLVGPSLVQSNEPM